MPLSHDTELYLRICAALILWAAACPACNLFFDTDIPLQGDVPGNEPDTEPCPGCVAEEGERPVTESFGLACTDGRSLVACESVEPALFGQDGHYDTLEASFRPDVGVIHDEITGLSWEARPTGPVSLQAAEAYCETLGLGGFEDWRVPEIEDLITLISLKDPSGIFTDELVTFTELPIISRTPAADGTFDWGLLTGKHVSASKLRNSANMHCVRGPQPSGLFVREGAVVQDRVTGLMWQQSFSEMKMPWQQALFYCESLELAGLDDWRLPSYKELLTLVQWRASPAISTDAFAMPPGEPSANFWSSSMVIPDCVDDLEQCGWIGTLRAVDFISGTSGGGFGDTSNNHVRCVR